MAWHSLLERQIKRHLDGVDFSAEPCRSFIAAVDDAYRGFDADRRLVERSMELSSEELIGAHSTLRAIVQAFPDLLLRIDTAGLVVEVLGTTSGVGWREDALLGRGLAALLPADVVSGFEDAMRRTSERRAVETLEFVDEQEGHRIATEIRLAPLGAGGAVALVRDVTAQRRALDLSVAKEAAEASSRAKSAFLANMSHELRTPLNAIVGYSEMLSEDAVLTGPSSLVDDLGRITAAARHLMRVVNTVLDITRIEAGRVSVDVGPVHVGTLVEYAVAAVEPAAQANGNCLQATADRNLPTLMTDATKLQQVLINLLGNACKFTQNGAVSIDVAPAESAGREGLAFAVRDTGIGIEPDCVPLLFRDFGQVDDSITRRYGGTGLGLSISRRLCHLLGGEIAVESQPGRGSVFTVWLPLAVPEDESSLAPRVDESAEVS